MWLPVLHIEFLTMGIGPDDQIFSPAINGALRSGNMPWNMMTKILGAREDIFSYPYFGLLYPFYWTLGVNADLSYSNNLLLDAISVLFHMVVASITFSLFLKRIGCRKDVAVVYGLFYAYSLHLKMWSIWIWAISGYSWLPLCLLGIWECICKKNYRFAIICLSIGYGFIALGTGLTLVYAVILGGAFFCACILYVKPSWAATKNIFLCLGSGACLSFLIGASHLLPTLLRSSGYIRWYTGGSVEGSLKIPYEGTLEATLDFSFATLGQFIAPINWAQGLGSLYLGACVLVAFFYYLSKYYKQTYIYPLLIVALFFFLDAFGDQLFVHKITYQFPLLNSIRYPVANVFISIVVILIMSAKGLSDILGAKKITKRLKQWIILLAGFTVFAVAYQHSLKDQLIGGYRSNIALAVMATPLIAGCLILIFHNSKYVLTLVLILFSCQLVQTSTYFHPKVGNENSIYINCDTFNNLYESLRVARKGINGTARLMIHFPENWTIDYQGCASKLITSNMLLESLALMSGWDVNQIYQSPRPAKEFWQFLTHAGYSSDHDRLLRAGITHVLLSKPLPASDIRNVFYSKVAEIGLFTLYEIEAYRTGLASVGCIKASRNGNVIFSTPFGEREIINNGVELKQSAFCKLQDTEHNIIQFQEGKRGASFLEYKAEQLTNGLFISDQVFSNDWKVKVNGENAIPFKIDDFRLAVYLPKDKSSIILEHKPFDFQIGLWLSYIGIILLLIIIVGPTVKNKPCSTRPL